MTYTAHIKLCYAQNKLTQTHKITSTYIHHHKTHLFILLTPKIRHHFSLTSHIVSKTLTCKESLETTTLSDKCIFSAHKRELLVLINPVH